MCVLKPKEGWKQEGLNQKNLNQYFKIKRVLTKFSDIMCQDVSGCVMIELDRIERIERDSFILSLYIQPCVKIGLMGSRGPHTHWLFPKMHEKWFPNVFGSSQGTYFFLPTLQKNSKIHSFVLEWWFLHVNRSVFHQELNRKGPRVHGGPGLSTCR